jgi:hypothetical protein
MVRDPLVIAKGHDPFENISRVYGLKRAPGFVIPFL